MADPLVSPGAAFAEQARMEVRVQSVLLSQFRAFLDDVLTETLASRRYVSGAFYAEAWTARMSASALAQRLPQNVAEYIATGLALSPIPDEAFTSAMSVLARSEEQAWSKTDMEAALRAALSVESAETFLTAAAPVVQKDENGRPVYRRTAGLDVGGVNWKARLFQEARTAITGLWNDLAVEGIALAAIPDKMWVTRHDERVREEHAEADGQVVPVDEPFYVGGYPMKHPGDRSAPVHLTINCRCIVVGAGGETQFGQHPDFAAIIQSGDEAALEAWLTANGGFGKQGARPVFDTILTDKHGDSFVSGHFVDENGNLLGQFNRRINVNDGVVYHDLLKLKEEARRQGLATEWNARMEEMYDALGIKNIKLTASEDDGGYVWAKAGYDWDLNEMVWGFEEPIQELKSHIGGARFDYSDQPDVIAYLDRLESQYDDFALAVHRASMEEDKFNEAVVALSKMPSPASIANVTFPGAPNLGSELLRGTTWYGEKAL